MAQVIRSLPPTGLSFWPPTGDCCRHLRSEPEDGSCFILWVFLPPKYIFKKIKCTLQKFCHQWFALDIKTITWLPSQILSNPLCSQSIAQALQLEGKYLNQGSLTLTVPGCVYFYIYLLKDSVSINTILLQCLHNIMPLSRHSCSITCRFVKALLFFDPYCHYPKSSSLSCICVITGLLVSTATLPSKHFLLHLPLEWSCPGPRAGHSIALITPLKDAPSLIGGTPKLFRWCTKFSLPLPTSLLSWWGLSSSQCSEHLVI